MWISSCSSTISWKDNPFSIGLRLLLCKGQLIMFLDSILLHCSVLSSIPEIPLASQCILKSGSISPSTSFFPSRTVLAILGRLLLHVNFRISLLMFTNNLLDFNWCVWMYIKSGRIEVFSIINLLVHKLGIYLHLFRSALISFIRVLKLYTSISFVLVPL